MRSSTPVQGPPLSWTPNSNQQLCPGSPIRHPRTRSNLSPASCGQTLGWPGNRPPPSLLPSASFSLHLLPAHVFLDSSWIHPSSSVPQHQSQPRPAPQPALPTGITQAFWRPVWVHRVGPQPLVALNVTTLLPANQPAASEASSLALAELPGSGPGSLASCLSAPASLESPLLSPLPLRQSWSRPPLLQGSPSGWGSLGPFLGSNHWLSCLSSQEAGAYIWYSRLRGTWRGYIGREGLFRCTWMDGSGEGMSGIKPANQSHMSTSLLLQGHSPARPPWTPHGFLVTVLTSMLPTTASSSDTLSPPSRPPVRPPSAQDWNLSPQCSSSAL